MSQSVLHEILIRCAIQCREFANEHRSATDSTSESIVLSIDCAELCCQMSVLYRSGSARVEAVAKQCIRTCESLTRQLAYCTEASSKRLLTTVDQALRCCQLLVKQEINRQQTTHSIPATVCYGITVPTGVYPL